jgi:RHS repeat-associated protein
VVKYAYDAWGVCDTIVLDENAANIANLNPFRYRSYYLDTGLNLYYLPSMYYDASVGRFINADDAATAVSNNAAIHRNVFCYCENDPTNNYFRIFRIINYSEFGFNNSSGRNTK